MSLLPRERKPLRSEVVDALIAEIFERNLKPGDKLGTELELSERLSVSRNIFREAVRDLSTLGIIEVRRALGLYVCEPTLAPSITQLKVSTGMNPEMYKQLFEARKVIELGIARLVVENARIEDIVRLAAIITEEERLIRSGTTDKHHSLLDMQFHLVLLRASQNRVLSRFGGSLVEYFRSIAPVNRSDYGIEDTISDHRRILDALKERDQDTYVNAMSLHLHEGEKTLLLHQSDLEPGVGSF